MSVPVAESSQIAEARRAAVRCAKLLGFDETDVGRVALVATELATNLVRHARGGEIVCRAAEDERTGAHLVELLVLDQGPGMNVTACLTDGYSSAGSGGTGLGAVQRAADLFDVYSSAPQGTVLLAQVSASRAAALSSTAPAPFGTAARPADRLDASGLCVPRIGETECGDAWAVRATPTGLMVMVADGLGHGPMAAAASRAAILHFAAMPASSTVGVMEAVHQVLRPTRGAAVAVAEIDPGAGLLRFCGVGNISGRILTASDEKHLISHNGTAGHEMRRAQEFSYEWSEDTWLLLHSDGVATHWRMREYPGLLLHHPGVVAGALYRDGKRGRDDATVVAVRQRRTP